MSSFKNDQRRLTHRGRTFHFVSYDGHPADVKRNLDAQGPTWFLMGPGKRWPVMPHEADQPAEQVDDGLRAWLESHVFA